MKKTALTLAISLACMPWLAASAAPNDTASVTTEIQQTPNNPDLATLEQRIQTLEAQLNSVQHQQERSALSNGQASDWTKRIRINGFATFGAQITDLRQDGATYNDSGNNDGHVSLGTSDSWDHNTLSRAGLQVTANLTDRTQLVTQFLARGRDNYHTSMQWAYLSHKLTSNLTVRAGRLVLPFYMHSQYNDVSYAYPWPSLPDEVYSTVPGETADGLDIIWDFTTGPINHSFNLQWANTDVYASNSNLEVEKYHVQNLISSSLSSTWNSLTVRLGYASGNVDHQSLVGQGIVKDLEFGEMLYGLTSGAEGVPPGTSTLVAGALDIDHGFAYFANAGFRYDDGRFLLMSEWAQLDIHGYFPRTRSSYTTAGMYFGRWLSTVTYGRVDTSDHEKPLAVIGQGAAGAKQQKRWGYGLRFDVTNNVSIKGEVSHIFGFSGTNGLFSQKPEHHVNLFRLSVDAMF